MDWAGLLLLNYSASENEAIVTQSNPAQASVKPLNAKNLEARLKKTIAEQASVRAKILSGAVRVLRKKGLNNCSVEDILLAAEISRGSFYQYFQNKYDVAATLLKYVQTILIQLAQEASIGERRPSVRMANTFDVYVNAQTQLGWLYSMLLAEAKQIGSPLASVREELFSTMIALIDSSITNLQGRKVEKDVFRALLYAVEDLMLFKQSQGKFSDADASHVRAVMQPIVQRTLAMQGDELLSLPLANDTEN